MVPTGSKFAPFRFSTDGLPAKDRIPFWREVLGRSVAKLDVEPLAGEGVFRCEASGWAMPGLAVLSARAVPYSTTRTAELIAAEERDDIVLVTARGGIFASQRGREAIVAPGDGVLISNAGRGVVNFLSAAPNVSVIVPRAMLAPMVTNLEAALICPIRRDNGNLRLLAGYLELVNASVASATPELRRLFVLHVHDLLAALIGADRDAAEIAKGRGIRAARMQAVKTDIAKNLAGDVSAAAIARRLGVSPRYVQKLFEGEGMSLSRFVLGQRLARVHRMLAAPHHDRLTIGEIAYSVGFGDLSTFNREFRRCYGATPKEVRSGSRN